MLSAKQKFLGAALGGMFTASLALAQGTPPAAPTDSDSMPKKEEPKMATDMGECHGVNACKGKGDCHQKGKHGHGCAGKNACKGKGWTKMTKEDCTAAKQTGKMKKHFVPSAG